MPPRLHGCLRCPSRSSNDIRRTCGLQNPCIRERLQCRALWWAQRGRSCLACESAIRSAEHFRLACESAPEAQRTFGVSNESAPKSARTFTPFSKVPPSHHALSRWGQKCGLRTAHFRLACESALTRSLHFRRRRESACCRARTFAAVPQTQPVQRCTFVFLTVARP